MKVELSVTGSEQQVRRFMDMADRIRAELVTEMEFQVAGLVTYIADNKLGGQVLKAQSGRLRAALNGDVTINGTDIVGRAYVDDVPYAALQEYGGTTRPHAITAVNARALKFFVGGTERFAKTVQHPGSVMPERSYMRSGLEDRSINIIGGIRDAVLKGARG